MQVQSERYKVPNMAPLGGGKALGIPVYPTLRLDSLAKVVRPVQHSINTLDPSMSQPRSVNGCALSLLLWAITTQEHRQVNAHEMTFKDFEVGDVLSFIRHLTPDQFQTFSTLSGDTNFIHESNEHAAKAGLGQAIAPLMLAAAPLSAVVGNGFGRHRALILSVWIHAVEQIPYDRDITYSAKIAGKHEASKTLTLNVIAFHGEQILLKAEILVQIRDDVPFAPPSPDALEIEPVGRRKSALITGASGAIGGVTARLMAKHGWDLALFFNTNRPAAEALAEECCQFGSTVSVYQASLDDEKKTQKMVRSLLDEIKPVAFLHLASPRLDAPLASQFNVNYRAARQIMQGLLPEMLRRQQGTLLVLGTSASHYAVPGWEDYIASKNALVGFANSIESRFAAYGIRGKVVAPGYVDTAFSESVRPASAPFLLAEEVAEAIVDHLEDKKPDCPSYLWLEPGTRRYGSIGFKERVEEQARPATVANDVSSQPRPATPATSLTSQGGAGIEGLVRRFFKLPPLHPLADGGLGATPGWDSLAHIELIVFLESQLGITFTTQEMAGVTHMQTMVAVVERKLGVDSGARSER